VERRYYLSSLTVEVAAFARAVRGHWGVENKLHWVLDVQMNEDQSRARAGYAAENLATLRRLALEPVETGEVHKAGHQGQATQRQLEPRLSVTPARSGHLDASALAFRFRQLAHGQSDNYRAAGPRRRAPCDWRARGVAFLKFTVQ
jgi:hypothetical protein